MDFLWRKVGKAEQKKIKKEAKRLMDNFAKALAKVEKKKISFSFVQRKKQTRKESEAASDSEFRKAFFDNVPNKEGNCVKAEKGKWK